MRLGPLVWQRPQYVEILDAEGRHTVMPLRDLDHTTVAALLDGDMSHVAWKRNGYGRVGLAVAVAAVTVWRITRRATR
jgi:hypothetical protein